MATASAVELVRACLEQEPPHGLRVGPPQISGTLSLFPIFRDAAALDYVTLAEAQEAKSVEIRELDARGAVSRLAVKNAGALPVLIIDGDVLLGLKQDRVLNTTILVPAQSTLEIPVSCIEAGRWRQVRHGSPGRLFRIAWGSRREAQIHDPSRPNLRQV